MAQLGSTRQVNLAPVAFYFCDIYVEHVCGTWMRDICCLIRGFVSTYHIQLWLHDIENHHDIDICDIYYDIFATNDTHG